MSKFDKKVYEFNKTTNNEKKYLSYNGKEYEINCGYKTLKYVMKALKKIDDVEDETEELEKIIIELIGEKAFNAIVDNSFTIEDFTTLFKIILAAAQGVEPEDMDDFFSETNK